MTDHINFDGALKEFFERRRPSLLLDLTGGVAVKESLNVELPKVHDRKVDLVLLLADDSLLHIEFQSTNRRDMAFRMAEYYLLLLGRYKRTIRQVVLYVGRLPMHMNPVLEHGPMRFSYTLKDIREWPAEDWLDSDRFADQVLAILGGTSNARQLVRRILQKLSRLEGPDREAALAQLPTLSGLRRFETILIQEARRMEVLINWKENPILREVHDDVLAEGLEKGRVQGRRGLLRDMLMSTFGEVPRWAEERINRASEKQITAWAVKVPTARRIQDVIRAR